MTEAEARTKWCPMVRGERGYNRVKFGEPDPWGFCVGSRCMMWRWLPDGAAVNGQFTPFGSLSSTHGECGLSRAAQ